VRCEGSAHPIAPVRRGRQRCMPLPPPRALATALPGGGPRDPAAARPRTERPAYRNAGAAAAAVPAATAAASTVGRSRSAWTSAVMALLHVAQRAAQFEQW